jgi:hypothetical protein
MNINAKGTPFLSLGKGEVVSSILTGSTTSRSHLGAPNVPKHPHAVQF